MKGALFFIGFRYLLGRAAEGGRYLRGATAGIALSLVPIIVTLIVADGMIRGIMDRYLELGTGHLQVYNFSNPYALDDAVNDIAELEGIRGVWRERSGLGVIIGSQGRTGTTIRAVENAFWQDRESVHFLKVIDGSSNIENDREVILGQALAETIGAEVGKTVRIMTLRMTDDGRNIPRITPFTVRGIISSGYRELDALWGIMSYEAGRDILPPRSPSYLIVKVDDPYSNINMNNKLISIYQVLGTGFSIYTWQQLLRSQYTSYESTRQLLLLIMALIVLIAAVNVSSATSMLVIERQRDIAVLKTGGASPSATTRIFLWGSFLTGLIGAVIGISLGLLIGNFINQLIRGLEAVLGFFSHEEVNILDPSYYLETIPIIIDWNTVFLIGFFTVLCSVVASWIPARRAGKIKPIEILRKY